MNIYHKTFLLISILGGIILFNFVQAADFFLVTPSTNTAIGDKFWVDARIDSEDVGFNAAQATIKFPKDILEVIDLDRDQSVFGFWLEEPAFSNDKGEITFIGGSAGGSAGRSLQALRINFKVKGSGTADLVFADGTITASDGSGTNILSMMRSLKISSVVRQAILEIITKVEKPAQIVRTPVPTGKLPIEPVIDIPLYPSPEKWYNISSPFFVNWKLPKDVNEVAIALNKNPIFLPTVSEGLFESKQFVLLESGIWYIHVRFKNDVGWGPAVHYRVAIDTTPPISFLVTVTGDSRADNPSPVLNYQSSDTLSGLDYYEIKIDDRKSLKTSEASFALPPQTPGKHIVRIRAIDKAGNISENNIDLEITPITSPTIIFVPKELLSEDESGLTIKGTALPGVDVLLKIQRLLPAGGGEIAADGTTHADDKRNWDFTFNEPLKNGRYIVLAQSRDARGAISLTVESPPIKVKSKPIIQIGFIQLGKGGAALLLLLILVVGFGGGIWFYKKRQEKLAMRVAFTESEITKIFQLIREDVERLAKARETPATSDDEYAMKRLQENIQKMEAYLKKGVEKIKNK